MPTYSLLTNFLAPPPPPPPQMRFTGIPELTCVEDTDYIREVLMLDARSDREAEQAFLNTIQVCLKLKWTVQVMWLFHTMKHKGGSS